MQDKDVISVSDEHLVYYWTKNFAIYDLKRDFHKINV